VKKIISTPTLKLSLGTFNQVKSQIILKSEAISDFDLPDGLIQKAYEARAFKVAKEALGSVIGKVNQKIAILRKGGQKSIFAFGDLHGALDIFVRELYVSGLINEEGHWLTKEERFTRYGNKGNVSVIQAGDFFDRGFYSWELYEYLKTLQHEAKANGDNFVILLGNHELSHLEDEIYGTQIRGSYSFLNFLNNKEEKLEIIRKELKDDIMSNRIQLASLIDGRVYTHAGVITKHVLKEEENHPEILVKRLNNELKNFVKMNAVNAKNSFLFSSAGPLRNRSVSNLALIKQIYGHNPPHREKLESYVRVFNDGQHYNIDTGQSPYFSKFGRMCFLSIIDDKPLMVFSDETKEHEGVKFDLKLPPGNRLVSYPLAPLNFTSWQAEPVAKGFKNL
jgi:hypothetical protein